MSEYERQCRTPSTPTPTPHPLAGAVAGPAVAGPQHERRRPGRLPPHLDDPGPQVGRRPERVDERQVALGDQGGGQRDGGAAQPGRGGARDMTRAHHGLMSHGRPRCRTLCHMDEAGRDDDAWVTIDEMARRQRRDRAQPARVPGPRAAARAARCARAPASTGRSTGPGSSSSASCRPRASSSTPSAAVRHDGRVDRAGPHLHPLRARPVRRATSARSWAPRSSPSASAPATGPAASGP